MTFCLDQFAICNWAKLAYSCIGRVHNHRFAFRDWTHAFFKFTYEELVEGLEVFWIAVKGFIHVHFVLLDEPVDDRCS